MSTNIDSFIRRVLTAMLMVALVAAALLLTGCSSEDKDSSDEDKANAIRKVQEAYVDTMRGDSYFNHVSDQDLIDLGIATCGELDRHYVGTLADDLPDEPMSTLLLASSTAFCRDHKPEVWAYYDLG